MSNNNINTVKFIPSYTEVIAIPRINQLDDFFKEYSNHAVYYARWMNELNKHCSGWTAECVKKTSIDYYLLYPEEMSFNSNYYIELFKGHPRWYGFIVKKEYTLETSFTKDFYDQLCDTYLTTGQRTFTNFELQEYLVK